MNDTPASTTADNSTEGGSATDVMNPAQAPAADATTTPPTEPVQAEVEVPESYDLQMPEGIELDKAAADEFTTLAKELKLDQATAQKFADVGAKMAQRQQEAHAKLVESWVEAVKADKEIGGDKLQENLAVARKALDAFGSPELRDVLNMTGIGNNPAVIKAFYRAGKAISEDQFVTGKPQGADTDMAKKLFPSMN